jgi:hypothetical protein
MTNLQQELAKESELQLNTLKERLDQEPLAWYMPDIKMTTTNPAERDRWLKAGHRVWDLIRKN